MAKKAKTVSWRTLARRAKQEDKKGRKGSAGILRAQSAAARRADRVTKRKKKAIPAAAVRAAIGWATRRANEIEHAAASLKSLQTGANRKPSEEAWQATTQAMAVDRGAPGHGEVVGGAYAELAERIAKLARKKGGMNGVYNELAALAQTKHYEGCVETDKAATARLIEVQQIIADRVVCGFIAEVDHAMKFHSGLPPDQSWIVNSFLITKIVDALNKAGYSARGKVNTGTVMGVERNP